MPATLARLERHPDALIDSTVVAVLREADPQDGFIAITDIPRTRTSTDRLINIGEIVLGKLTWRTATADCHRPCAAAG